MRQALRRLRCWFRGYHTYDAVGIGKFRFDVSGMCHDCGHVGDGVDRDPP